MTTPPTGQSLAILNARVVTPLDVGPARGEVMGTLITMPSAHVTVRDGRIASIVHAGAGREAPAADRVIDARGRALLPGLIDCHTHACWAGQRLEEWEQRRAGVSYLDVLRAGGGIMSTVRAVRDASRAMLRDELLERASRMLRNGATTIEVKSGYGLSTQAELKMLEAIAEAQGAFAGTLVPTALLGHALDPDVPAERFVRTTIEETLPAVHASFPGIAIDAYCEQGAWSVAQCAALFDAAHALGHPCRVHADQFHALGMAQHAVQRGFVSVDHLEASTQEGLAALAMSGCVGVGLPACCMHAEERAAPLARLIALGGAAAVATNCNPGSAPCFSLPLAMGWAVRRNGLSPTQALNATTRNAGAVLGLRDRGVVRAGMRADLLLLHGSDERTLAYELGDGGIAHVIAAGRVVA